MALPRKILLIFSLLFCTLHGVSAFAEEKITNFVTNTNINSDGSADVTEKITVQTEQQELKHGLVRWMPVYFRDAHNNHYKIRYFFFPPLVNGLPAAFHMSYGQGSTAFFVGSQNALLPPGTYIYTLHYRVLNAITYALNNDQFYWNITGNFWKVPIENVDATIYLPKGVTTFDFSGYTGRGNTRGRDFFVSKTQTNTAINFVTTRTLLPGEGLTIALAWPKGFVAKPGWRDKIAGQFIYHNGNGFAVFFTILLLGYYLWLWFREAHKPLSGASVSLFQPPQGLSPTVMRFVIKMNVDIKTLSIAIISMAVKGFLTIEHKNDVFTLQKQTAADVELSLAENAVATKLFSKADFFTIEPARRVKLTAALKKLKRTLREEFEKIYFVTHAAYLLPGILLSMLAIISIAYATNDFQDVLVLGCILLFALTYLSNRLVAMSELIADFARAPTSRNGMNMLVGSLLIGLIVLLAGVMIKPLTDVLSLSGFILLSLLLYLNILFYNLLRARAPTGRKLLSQIEGFKQFLSMTGKQRLKKINQPEMTPELYKKYLAYAVALDVENSWALQFAPLFVAAEKADVSPPLWYTANPATLVTDLTASLATSIYSGPADRRQRR